VVDVVTAFARAHGIRAARLHGIGAFTGAELGFLDRERREYDHFRVEEEVEVLALLGNLSVFEGEPRVHAHVTLGKRDGSAVGGHLFEAHVGATLELFVLRFDAELSRAHDEATGAALLDL
jgi:uncharacterized protein